MSVVSDEFDEENYERRANLASEQPLIREVVVRGLHGRSNYRLDLQSDQVNGRLSLFYGDNGSGKTTILLLLWDLLSPASKRNHRSRIARVAFSEFRVELGGGTVITAKRKLPVAGPYDIEVRRNNRLRSRSSWPDTVPYESFFDGWEVKQLRDFKTSDTDIKRAWREALGKKQYIDDIEAFGTAPYFLADDRTPSSDELVPNRAVVDPRRARPSRDEVDSSAIARRALSDALERALSLVNGKLRRLALGGAVSGSANANSVYLDVISRLAIPGGVDVAADRTRQALIVEVRAMGQRSRKFEALGLVPRFESVDYVRAIEHVPDAHLPVLGSILRPYLQSLEARLEALDGAQSLIQTLLDEANGYLSDKRLVYRNRTMHIELLDGESLQADQLSSGECHMLLLLFSAVIARDSSRLFLIDEPELSLNVKWQRRIVRSLLSLTQGSGLQFVVATHSIELLSAYRDRVVRLNAQGSIDD